MTPEPRQLQDGRKTMHGTKPMPTFSPSAMEPRLQVSESSQPDKPTTSIPCPWSNLILFLLPRLSHNCHQPGDPIFRRAYNGVEMVPDAWDVSGSRPSQTHWETNPLRDCKFFGPDMLDSRVNDDQRKAVGIQLEKLSSNTRSTFHGGIVISNESQHLIWQKNQQRVPH